MEILSLDQQKKAILYAPKDLLWKILDAEEGSWLKILSLLPEDYYAQFLNKLRLLGIEDNQQVKNMAKIYVQNKVRMDHLQEAVVHAWNPADMEDATSFLKANGFLRRPLLPLNLQAEVDDSAIIAEALSIPRATRERFARMAKGVSPR